MKKKLLFWIPTILLLLPMVGSAFGYFADPIAAGDAFESLGYPRYVMWFNALAKIFGGVAIIVSTVPRWLKEFAYAGYLYILLLATQAIWMGMGPANAAPMPVFIAIWAWAYYEFYKRQ